MSSGGRSAEQQAVAEHNLEGQHQALLQELRDECGKDCKRPHRHTFNFAPPCVDPAMDENLTRNAQLSVLELSPCRFEQHQPVELGFRVQSLFEPAHGKPTKIVLQATPGELRPTPLELTNALIFVNAADEEKLALEEQVASLQGELDDSLQLLAEAHHSRCGLLKSMQAALVVTSEQLARAKANAQVTAAHFRQDRMLRAACLACTFAALLHNLYVTWIVHDVKADHVALKADFVSYYEDCLDIAAKEMAPVYQNCQDVLATCESVQRNVWSYFSAQVAFAVWLRGLGLD